MADMGYCIKQHTVMEMAFMVAEKTHKDHPFREGKAGHAWFEGFLWRHPKLAIVLHRLFRIAELFVPTERMQVNILGNLAPYMGDLI